MTYWTVDSICRVASGKALNADAIIVGSSPSIDSRTTQQGDIFFAIRGERFDGHDFIGEAFTNGASAAIVDRKINTDQPLIIVDDVIQALQKLAQHYLTSHLGKVIAITGSVGKTTTKEVLGSLLQHYGVTYATQGNLNNHIGLPLSILRAPIDAQYLIFEMGMSGFGEIKLLSQIAAPQVAVITNVEPAHLSAFSSLEDVALAKSEVFCGVRQGGAVVINADNQFYHKLLAIAQSYPNISRCVSFGRAAPACDVQMLAVTIREEYLSFSMATNGQLTVPGRSENMVYAVLASLAALKALSLPILDIEGIVKTLALPQGRGKTLTLTGQKNLTLIDESYNASPASMLAAIRTLSTYHSNRKVLIIGDMLELGDDTIKFHTDLLAPIEASEVHLVCTVGGNMSFLHKLLPTKILKGHFDDHTTLVKALDDLILNQDVILIKGSAKLQLSKVVDHIVNMQNKM